MSTPQHISELLCPPVDKIKKYGRLNTPKEQILYLSETPQTVYKEIRASEGDEVILIRFIPRERRKPFRVSTFINENIDYNPMALNTVKAEALSVIGSEHNYKKVIELRSQVADILQKEVTESNEDYYKLTSAFSKNIFRNSIDGILYPSIQTEKVFFNLAAKPSVIDSHFIGHTVVRIKLEKISNMTHCVYTIKNGFVDKEGFLVWDDSTVFEFPS